MASNCNINRMVDRLPRAPSHSTVYHSYRCFFYSQICILLLHLLQSSHASRLESHNQSLSSRFAYATHLIPEFNKWRVFVEAEKRRTSQMVKHSISSLDDEFDVEGGQRRLKVRNGESDGADSDNENLNIFEDGDQLMDDDDLFPMSINLNDKLFSDLDFNSLGNVDEDGGEAVGGVEASPASPMFSPQRSASPLVITLDSRSSSPVEDMNGGSSLTLQNIVTPSTSSPLQEEIITANTAISELVKNMVDQNREDLNGLSNQGSSTLVVVVAPSGSSQVAPQGKSIAMASQDSSNGLPGDEVKNQEILVRKRKVSGETDTHVAKLQAVVLPSFQAIATLNPPGGTFKEVIGIDGSRRYAIDGSNPFDDSQDESPSWKSIDFSDMEAMEAKMTAQTEELSNGKRRRRSVSAQEQQFVNPPAEVRSNLLQQYLTAPQSFRQPMEQFEGQQMSPMSTGNEGYFQQQIPPQQPIPFQRQAPVYGGNRPMSSVPQSFMGSPSVQGPFPQNSFDFRQPMRGNRLPDGAVYGQGAQPMAMGQGVGNPQASQGMMGNAIPGRLFFDQNQRQPQMNPNYVSSEYGMIPPQNRNMQMNPQMNQYPQNMLPNGNGGQAMYRSVPGNNFGERSYTPLVFQAQGNVPSGVGGMGPPRSRPIVNMEGNFVGNQGPGQFQGQRQFPMGQGPYQMSGGGVGVRQDIPQFAGMGRPSTNINMGARLTPAVEMQGPSRGQIPPGFPDMRQGPGLFNGNNGREFAGTPVNQGMNPPQFYRNNDMSQLGPTQASGRSSVYFAPIQPAPYGQIVGGPERRPFDPSPIPMNYPRNPPDYSVRQQPFYQQNVQFASENLGARATNTDFLQGRPNERRVISQPRGRPNVDPYQVPEKCASGKFNCFEPQTNFVLRQQGRYNPQGPPFQPNQQVPTSGGFAYGVERKPEYPFFANNRPQGNTGDQFGNSGQFPPARDVFNRPPQAEGRPFISRSQTAIPFQGGYLYTQDGGRGNIAAVIPRQRVIEAGSGGGVGGPINGYPGPRGQIEPNFSGQPGIGGLPGPRNTQLPFPNQQRTEQVSRPYQQQPPVFNGAPGFNPQSGESRNGLLPSGNGGRGDQPPAPGKFVIPIIDGAMGRANIQQSAGGKEQPFQLGGVPNRVDHGQVARQPQNPPLPGNGGYNLVVGADGNLQLREGPGNRVNYGDAPKAPSPAAEKLSTPEQNNGKTPHAKKHLPHHGGDMPLHSQSELDDHHRRLLNNATTAQDSKFENEQGLLSWYLHRAREELRSRQKSPANQNLGSEARPSSQGSGQGPSTVSVNPVAAAIQPGNFSAAQLPIATPPGVPSPSGGSQAVERLPTPVQLSPAVAPNRGLFAVSPAPPVVQKPEDETTVDGRLAANGLPPHANQNGLPPLSRSASSSPISPPVPPTFANANVFGNGTHPGGTGVNPGSEQNSKFGG